MRAEVGLSTVDPLRPRRASEAGLRLSSHVATTAHLPAVYPFQAEAGIGERGVYLGWNRLAGDARFCWEPFECYSEPRIGVTSPNVLFVGIIGEGKSAAVKTFLCRALAMLASPDGSPRWAVVYDPKGEYRPLAAALGMQWVSLRPGGRDRLNPLDPGPVPKSERVELELVRVKLVAGLLSAVMGRELSQMEASALDWSIRLLGDAEGEAQLGDLVALWREPPADLCLQAAMSPEVLRAELGDMRLCLGRLCDGELRGMFNGPSTVHIDPAGRGLVVDLSAVFTDSHALPLVMLCVDAWTQQLYMDPNQVGRRSYKVIDEAWAVLEHESIARSMQASSKLSRSRGCASIYVVHRLSDLAAQAADGTATAKIGAGLLADCQTQVIFAQPEAEIAAARRMLGLTNTEALLVPKLPKGRALYRIGRHRAVVQHHLGPFDLDYCNTDQRIGL